MALQPFITCNALLTSTGSQMLSILKTHKLYLSVFFSPAMTKHWEAELEALKGNNAKLTAALLESTANVKQWKQQLAAYQEEAERLHKRVSKGSARRACLFSCVIKSFLIKWEHSFARDAVKRG